MNIGLFFGTFNPIHTGHLILAEYFATQTELDKILFIVSPQNPLKEKKGLIDAAIRLQMVRLAIEGNKKFEACDIEFSLPQPSYTVHTLDKLSKDYPADKLVIIMGSDSLLTIEKWKDYRKILAGFTLFIYPRPGYPVSPTLWPEENIQLFEDAPLLNISGTFIRENLMHGKSLRYLLPENVEAYILKAAEKDRNFIS